ncbi:Npt1/Npt2 family nucleotide transporter [Sorangium sp. So ce854]|uniref:Npt1/Npt2 family nucleotide transporter n=1 Tax=Sorangium sp. So ce854 TaxID=3133322 RepID=UPI003F5DD9C4
MDPTDGVPQEPSAKERAPAAEAGRPGQLDARRDSAPAPGAAPSARPPSSRPSRVQPSAAPPGADTAVLGVPLTRVELHRTALLFCLLFLAALIFVVGRSARDALFLTKFPVTWIAPMWIVYGVASALAALAYDRIARRLPRARLCVAFALFGAITFALLRVLIGQEVRAAYLVFYVWSEIIANFTAVLVWAVAQDLHDPRSAKRLFGLIGSGRVVGTVACGFATGGIVTWIGTENLLFVLIAALLGMASLTTVLARRHPLDRPASGAEQIIEARLPRMEVWRSRYALTVALLTLLLFTVLTVGDYQFKALALTAYPGRDELARFMGFLYGAVGVIGLVVQLGVTPFVLRRHGVLGGLLAMPAAFTASTAALLASPTLAAATVLKLSDNALQFTIHDATMQLLFFPFPPALRERVRTLVSAIAKPLGYGLGALILLALAPVAAPGPALVEEAARLGLYSLPLCAAIIALLPLVRRGYFDAMRRTLMRRQIDTDSVVYGPQTRAILKEALYSRAMTQVLFAVDQLRQLDLALVREAVPALARHGSARVRALAVRLAAELEHDDGPEIARAALHDRNGNVRVAAVDALAALLREDAHDELVALARDSGAPRPAAAGSAPGGEHARDELVALARDSGAPRPAAGSAPGGEHARDERARDGGARDERARDGGARDERARDERARDGGARDERARDGGARDDEGLRLAAIAALLRHCGLDGMLEGAPRLRALLESPSPRDRAAAARVLGLAGRASLQRALARLLGDPDPAVRRAAVRAASSVADPRLVPQLADALAERALAPAAARAIEALGDAAIPELAARLDDEGTPRAARLAIPRVLARLSTQGALDALLTHIGHPDEGLRQKVLASASRLRLALRAPPAPLRVIRACIDDETLEHVRMREAYIDVRPRVASPLLDQHLLRRLRKGLIRVLRLCELAYPREVVALVRTHVFGPDPALRANAFEVLESMLDRPLRERLVALVDRLLELSVAFPARPMPPEAGAVAWIRRELARGEPYSAALALNAVAQHAIFGAAEDALAATRAPDPLVREAAAIAVAVTRPLGYRERLTELRADADPAVARYARYWAVTGGTGIDPEDEMYTTIEKVLFLQRVPLFSRVAGDDLVALARGSLVVSLLRGDVIFRQGEPGGALYSIISGEVRLTLDGREMARLGPHDVFGEMSLFDNEPRTSTAVVTEDAELLRVSAEDFHEAVRETAEIADAVIRVLNRRLREADRKLADAHARLSLLPKPPPRLSREPPAAAAGDAAPTSALDDSDLD